MEDKNNNSDKNNVFGKIEEILERLKKNEEESENLLNNPDKAKKKLEEAEEKIKNLEKGPFKDVLEDLFLMIQLVKAYIKKEYREVPWKTIVAIFAAILYVVNPFDVIPDAIPGIGYIDDAFVVALVAKQVHSDLQKFKVWRDESSN